jgi:hypothetical protein
MEHSPNYDKWRIRYLTGWCTDAQLDKLVTLNQITPSEAIEIRQQKALQSTN